MHESSCIYKQVSRRVCVEKLGFTHKRVEKYQHFTDFSQNPPLPAHGARAPCMSIGNNDFAHCLANLGRVVSAPSLTLPFSWTLECFLLQNWS